MTPTEEQRVGSKVDKLFALTSDMNTTLNIMVTRFDAHEAQHQQYNSQRELTCPHTLDMRKVSADVDAIAGIAREHGVRICNLEQWHADINSDEAVEAATRQLKMTPWKWLLENAEKIALAVIIAYLLYHFGL